MIRIIVLAIAPILLFCRITESIAADKAHFLDNGNVRIGVLLNAGGSVFHFGPSSTKRNLLNHYDLGRFVQQSYYGVPDGSKWDKKDWRWNPVQGGNYLGKSSTIISQKLKKGEIQIQTRPVHWATGAAIDRAVMEERITLDGNVAKIAYCFKYSGKTTHPIHDQEMPAVFADHDLSTLVFCDGDKPWTDSPLTRTSPKFPNEVYNTTECWAAYVNGQNNGLGVYFPGTAKITSYRFPGDGKAGPKGSACSYFAPIRQFAIKPGLDLKYDIYLTTGTVEEIRKRFRIIHQNQAK